MSQINRVTVTLADVCDVIRRRSAHMPGVSAEAVASELNARLAPLIGEHPMTTALRGDTVQLWIESRIDQELGAAAFDTILSANVAA
jgi:hypothetical protein